MVIIWLMMVNNKLVGGWPTPLKNDGVSNSWDDKIPNIWKKNSSHVPNHQPVMFYMVSTGWGPQSSSREPVVYLSGWVNYGFW